MVGPPNLRQLGRCDNVSDLETWTKLGTPEAFPSRHSENRPLIPDFATPIACSSHPLRIFQLSKAHVKAGRTEQNTCKMLADHVKVFRYLQNEGDPISVLTAVDGVV